MIKNPRIPETDQMNLVHMLGCLDNVHELRGGRYEADCPVCRLFGFTIIPRPGGYTCRCSGECDPGLIDAVLCRRQPRQSEQTGDAPRIVLASHVERKPIRWFWPGFIPFGMMTLLMGDPGQGKGTLCIDLAARFTTGRPMPLCSMAEQPGKVLLLTIAEDDPVYTICPRLEAAGAELSRVVIVQDLLSLPGDVPKIEVLIRENHCGLVVIDPLNAYLSAKIDSHVDQDIRRALSPLKLIFEQTGAAGLIVGHLNKGGNGGPAMYRGGGSIGIVGAARAVYAIGADPADPGRRVLAPLKMNIAEKPPALSFSLENDPRYDAGRVEWGSTVALTADDVLTWRPPSLREQKGDQAEAWYLERLADGAWHKSEDVEDDRQKAGISTITAKRARKDAGVVSKKKGFGAGAVWYVGLPGASGPPFDDTPDAHHRVSSDPPNSIEYHPPYIYTDDTLCSNDTLCTGEQNTAELPTELRAQVVAAWDQAGLDASSALLYRLIRRVVPDLATAIETGSEPELQALLRFAQTGEGLTS